MEIIFLIMLIFSMDIYITLLADHKTKASDPALRFLDFMISDEMVKIKCSLMWSIIYYFSSKEDVMIEEIL